MPTFTDTVRNAVVDAMTGAVSGGAIKVYDSQGGTLLVEYGPISFETAGTTQAGQAAITGLPLSDTGLANGAASYYEFENNASALGWSGPACHSGSAANWQASTTYAQGDLVYESGTNAYYTKKDAGDSGATFQRHLWTIQEIVLSGTAVSLGGVVDLTSGGVAAAATST